MKGHPKIRHPYTQACAEAGHKASATGQACQTCRERHNQASKRARGILPPIRHPYTEECRAANHIVGSTGTFCHTCRSKAAWATRAVTVPPSNGNGHKPDTTEWIVWGQEMVDAFIAQSHAVPPDCDPLRPEYVQRLIARMPR